MMVVLQPGRIWSKVRRVPGGCWVWTGALTKQGYGLFSYRKRLTLVHRYVVNAKPGLQVLHKCDNPACCNPEHLFLGLDKDNARDKAIKGRAPGKLTLGQRREVVHRNRAGESQRALGREYGVSQAAVSFLVRSGIHG